MPPGLDLSLHILQNLSALQVEETVIDDLDHDLDHDVSVRGVEQLNQPCSLRACRTQRPYRIRRNTSHAHPRDGFSKLDRINNHEGANTERHVIGNLSGR